MSTDIFWPNEVVVNADIVWRNATTNETQFG